MNIQFPKWLLLAGILGGFYGTVPAVDAQQIFFTSPHTQMHDSWYEHLGSSMFLNQSGRHGGWFFNWGAPVMPPYGGYAGRDAHFGFGFRKGNLRGNFNFWASQGSDRSMIMHAPTITVPHGGFGMIRQGSLRPFVTGWIPVIGGQPQWHSPLESYLNSPEAETYVRQRSEQQRGYDRIERVTPTLKKPETDPPLLLIDGNSKTNDESK